LRGQFLDRKSAFSRIVFVIDPMKVLAHDHRELNELLIAVHAAFDRIERGQSKIEDELHEIRDGIEAFHEALLEHFAREQEGLLPFVVSRLPEVKEASDGIIDEHDRIAAALTRVVHDLAQAEAKGAFVDWRANLGRFEELYSAHTKSELAFLERVALALASDPEATNELTRLLDD
jgi:hemerythrin-like domain-containing protein